MTATRCSRVHLDTHRAMARAVGCQRCPPAAPAVTDGLPPIPPWPPWVPKPPPPPPALPSVFPAAALPPRQAASFETAPGPGAVPDALTETTCPIDTSPADTIASARLPVTFTSPPVVNDFTLSTKMPTGDAFTVAVGSTRAPLSSVIVPSVVSIVAAPTRVISGAFSASSRCAARPFDGLTLLHRLSSALQPSAQGDIVRLPSLSHVASSLPTHIAVPAWQADESCELVSLGIAASALDLTSPQADNKANAIPPIVPYRPSCHMSRPEYHRAVPNLPLPS